MTETEMGWPRRNQLDYRPGDERLIEIELERLRDLKNHPFRIADDEQMQELIESIKYFGILNHNGIHPFSASKHKHCNYKSNKFFLG